MDEKSLTKRMHAFERKVYTGVKGLAGAGAVALVANWQSAWASMDDAREQFGALTGGEDVTNSVYENINNALANLGDAVADGGRDAIHEAGANFYITVLQNHARLWEIMPEQVRGLPTKQEDGIRAAGLLAKALGIN